MKSLSRKVDSFDGQTITMGGKPGYELGGFLGGGAAGVVYEGADVSEQSHVRPVAIKILNPVGFRLAPEDTLRRCVVARRGKLPGGNASEVSSSPTNAGVGAGTTRVAGIRLASSGGSGVIDAGGGAHGGVNNSNSNNKKPHKLGPEHVWWLVSPNTKQVLAAYIDPKYGNLVELPLPKCIEIWGYNPTMTAGAKASSCGGDNGGSGSAGGFEEGGIAGVGIGGKHDGSEDQEDINRNNRKGCDGELEGVDGGLVGTGGVEVQVDGMGVSIPWVPPKFTQWLTQRRKVRREICNMGRVGGHRNVVKLLSVLEFLQDSKSTLFLILELVTGGELLDHIRPIRDNGRGGDGVRSRGASAFRAEGAAQRYFGQLLSGLAYCHRQGICHRDLSPSNLLLAESPQGDAPPELKIADFGLSACCAVPSAGNENQDTEDAVPGSTVQHCNQALPLRVSSIVGSPHYMAPEVTSRGSKGYDGFKADAFSCGVVLYTMLMASLPFGRELARCPRYKRFRKWAERHRIGAKKNSSPSVGTVVHLPEAHHPKQPHASSSTATTTPAGVATHQQSSVIANAPSASPVPPQWLFPPTIPPAARSLLVSLLVPDPSRRMSVEQALAHPWVVGSLSGNVDPPSSCNNSHSHSQDKGADGTVADRSEERSSTTSAVSSSAVKTGGTGVLAGGGVVPTATIARPRGAGGVQGNHNFVPDWKALWEERRGAPRRDGDGLNADESGVQRRRGQEGGGRGERLTGGAQMSPEEMFEASCISFPSTTSFP